MARASTAPSAKSRQNTLDRMVRLEKPYFCGKRTKIEFATEKEPVKDVLDVSGLTIVAGTKPLCKDISFHLLKGEKVAIVGANGVGKSTFFKQLLKLMPALAGKIVWGKNVKIGYYDQELSGYNPSAPVIDELWNRHKALTEFEIRSALGGVLLTGENVYEPVKVISGGEKARLAFADLMLQKANVLILDEPTNHLDMHTKEILEDALCRFEGTLLLVSHDRYLLNKVPTKIAELTENGFVLTMGKYDDYKEGLRLSSECRKLTNAEEKKEEQKEKLSAPKSKEQRRVAAQNKDRLKKLEAEIAETEKEIEETEKFLENPGIDTDYKEIEAICTTLGNKKEALTALYEEWFSYTE